MRPALSETGVEQHRTETCSRCGHTFTQVLIALNPDRAAAGNIAPEQWLPLRCPVCERAWLQSHADQPPAIHYPTTPRVSTPRKAPRKPPPDPGYQDRAADDDF